MHRTCFAGLCAPRHTHRHRVLADGNRQAQLGTQVQANGLDGVVQSRTVLLVPSRAHPVGAQLDLGNVVNVRRSHIGQCLSYSHARRCSTTQNRERRALATRHGLTRRSVVKRVRRARHSHIGHRYLIRPHHLVTRD